MLRSRLLKFYLISCLAVIISNSICPENSSAGQGNLCGIIGGSDAVVDRWHGVVALVDAGQSAYFGQFGAGALIHPYWVATSAQNVMWSGTDTLKSPDDIEIISGEYDLLSPSVERIRVKRIVVHPDFDSNSKHADIALLELESPSQDSTILRISSDIDTTGEMATVVGWGLADFDNFPNLLQEIELPIVSREAAQSVYMEQTLTESMTSAGYLDSTDGPCQYDTGSPLIVSINGVQLLTALFSWNKGCDQPGYYGAYTSLSSLSDFIETHVPAADRDRVLPLILSGGDLDTVIEITNMGSSTAESLLISKNSAGEVVSKTKMLSLEPGITAEFTIGADFDQAGSIRYMVLHTTSAELDVKIHYSFNGVVSSAYSALPVTGRGDINITGIEAGEGEWTLISLVNPLLSEKLLEFESDAGDVRTVQLAPGENALFSIKDLFGGVAEPDISSVTIHGADNIAGVQVVSQEGGSFEEMILTGIAAAVQAK